MVAGGTPQLRALTSLLLRHFSVEASNQLSVPSKDKKTEPTDLVERLNVAFVSERYHGAGSRSSARIRGKRKRRERGRREHQAPDQRAAVEKQIELADVKVSGAALVSSSRGDCDRFFATCPDGARRGLTLISQFGQTAAIDAMRLR